MCDDNNSIDIGDVDDKIKGTKKNKSVTEEYLEYHDDYVKKFGFDRTLVLMQVGSFYETYATEKLGPDLKKLEEITEASIAHKGKNKRVVNIENPWMWGFPMIAASKFISILIENGYRLIMIDQVTPKPNIRREVVAIHSPATYLESSYKPASNFVSTICIEEIQQKSGQMLACVGMSAVDVSTGEVFIHESLSQFNDEKLGLDETLRFIKSIVPKEIVIFKENLQKTTEDYIIEYLDLKGKFYQFREYNKDHNKLIYQKKILERVYPNRENMTSIIDTLGLSKYIYARKALTNLLTYVSDHYEDLVKGLSDPVFFLHESNLILGNDAINQLNIVDDTVVDAPGMVKYRSLLDVINKTCTGMGRRYVKFRLVSPYTDVDTLNTIYDVVDTINKNKLIDPLEKILRKINDIERLYRKIKMQMLHPTNIVDFIMSFCAVSDLIKIVIKNNALESHFSCGEIKSEIEEINKLFVDTIDLEKAKTYTINDIKENIFMKGIYPDLDTLQRKIGTNHDVIDELLYKLNDMIPDKNARGMKIVKKHNKRDGWFFRLTSKRYEGLKKALDKIKVIKLDSSNINVHDFKVTNLDKDIKLSLPFLDEQNDDIEELLEKIMNIAYKYYVEFMKTIETKYSHVIVKTIDMVTKLDYYVSIARVAKEYNYVRPIISNAYDGNGYIMAEKLRHPIVERIVEHEYIPHDIHIGTDNLKGMLIYGLNAAGKSVLMKAIGISVILAQAGFYVPAQKYTFYPYRSLYTRTSGNDNLFRGLSSYSLEMVELNNIFRRSERSTLAIGDEVCRGTEHISGTAIVASTLLKLAEIGASFVFTTHLHELMELEEITSQDKIKAFHLSVDHDENNDRLIYDRELKPGSGERIYGITVAKYIIKDEEFIKKALEIKNKLINRNPNSGPISTQMSRYHKSLIMDRCELCGISSKIKLIDRPKNKLETHHINHQKDCENGFVKAKPHIKKNHISNLMPICEACHDRIHSENIEIEGIKMTSKGKKVIIKNNNTANK